MCLFVRFADGITWGPADESDHAYICSEDPRHVHCRICGSITVLAAIDPLGITVPDRPNWWVALLRGTSDHTHPACAHWVPITPRITSTKD